MSRTPGFRFCGISRFFVPLLECRLGGMQKAADSALTGFQTAEQKAEQKALPPQNGGMQKAHSQKRCVVWQNVSNKLQPILYH